jgi:hypothetical protein
VPQPGELGGGEHAASPGRQRVAESAQQAAGVQRAAHADLAGHEAVLGARLALQDAGEQARGRRPLGGDADVAEEQRAVLDGLGGGAELALDDLRAQAGIAGLA